MAENRIMILKRANKLFRQGKADAAVKEYKKILTIKPDDLEVRRIIGDLELRQNNIREAIEQFEWIGDYYLKDGFFTKSIAMYKRITRVDPNYEGVLFKLADLYTKQGLVMEAKQIYLDIAEECKRQNNQKKALDMYKKILEFDRTNIKMRLLLADNYLKEGMSNIAINEYLTAADILIQKKDLQRAEELLQDTLKKTQDIKLIEKLLLIYTKQEKDDLAIELLKSLGLEVFKNIDLLKILGELYLKKNLMNEAEIVFSKIAEIDPEETEVILRLGKVYLQREEYEKTFNLFLPIIDKNIESKKYDDATSLLRFIIASNNSYVPALLKLASIFKMSGKTNNLIALYESLIPVFEQKGMTEELKKILQELIQLSDSPFGYEEQLARLTGKRVREPVEDEGDKESEREKEFINFNLRIVNDAIKVSDFNKAVDVLKKAKATFPKNHHIREKIFEVYQQMDQVEMAVEEGKGLLELYKFLNMEDEYSTLLEKLAHLKPEDARVVELAGEEKTSIEIDFDRAELEEEISDAHMDEGNPDENDILLLSEAENVTEAPHLVDNESSKSLSAVLSEVDFYVNDGYLGDAEKLIDKLKSRYPGNQAIQAKIEKLERAKMSVRQKEKSDSKTSGMDFEIEGAAYHNYQPSHRDGTELIEAEEPIVYQSEDFSNIEIDIGEPESGSDFKLADTGVSSKESMLMDLDMNMDFNLDAELEQKITAPSPDMDFPLEPSIPLPDMYPHEDIRQNSRPEWEDSSMLKISEDAYSHSDRLPLEPEEEPLLLDNDDNLFEIESSIADESISAQRSYEDSKIDMKIPSFEKEPESVKPNIPQQEEELAFEIEFEDSQNDVSEVMPGMEIDKDLLIQSPSVSQSAREKSSDGYATSSSIDEIDLDSIMMDEEAPYDLDSPFKEASPDLAFDMEDEELLKDEALFVEEAYLELGKNAEDELECIRFWMKELEKQRTSTIEKNMMEIFEEFKKGVDEKIGQEDYDTRYNLGIAYKEMGLLEEAIHEFLISSKHPLKFFDSAGLLGMCFREKGMFGEAVTWFEKALETPSRRKEEYLAVKYELVITMKQKEDYRASLAMLDEIAKAAPNYRNVSQLYQEIQSLMR